MKFSNTKVHQLFTFHLQKVIHKILATTKFGALQHRHAVRCWWEVRLHTHKIGSGYSTNSSVCVQIRKVRLQL